MSDATTGHDSILAQQVFIRETNRRFGDLTLSVRAPHR